MDPENTNDKAPESGSSISSDLIRGHINTIILRTLYDGDKYGYEIINEIEQKSKGQYILKQPTLYSALKRLESQDYVTSYWGGSSNGGRRKYFQITDKGRQVVEQNLAEWEYSRTVIDSLISERDYDFSNPPPSRSVDFSLLKKSTTRVPMAHGGEEEGIELPEGFGSEDFSAEQAERQDAAQASPAEESSGETSGDETPSTEEEQISPEGQSDLSAEAQEDPAQPAAEAEEYTVPQPTPEEQAAASAASAASISAPFEEYAPQPAQFPPQQDAQPYAEQRPEEQPAAESEPQAADSAPAQDVPEEPRPLTEEEKKRIHENYRVLIGDDTDATSYYYSQVARKDRDERTSYDKEVFDDRAEDYAEPEPQPAYQQQPYEQQPPYPEEYPPYPQQPQEAYDEYQSSRQISSELLYSSKPAAERNYKELISRLYDRRSAEAEQPPAESAPAAEQAPARAMAEPAAEEDRQQYAADEQRPDARMPQQEQREEKAQPLRARAASNIEFYDVEEKAESDGLRITTTNGSRNRTISKAVGNTFDKGRALFFAAVIVFAIALAESIVNICLQRALQSSVAYVVIPFVIDFVLLGVFLFLFLSGYGKNSRKTQSRTYISASLVIFANLVLIICLVAYFIIAFSQQTLPIGIQVVKYGLFPTIYAFNIPLFAIFYRYQCNRQ